MSKCSSMPCVALALATLAFSHLPHAATHDAVDDFSNVSNASTDTWSYRHSGDLFRDGDYGLLANHSDTGFWDPPTPVWWDAGGFPGVPGIGVNTSGGDIGFVGNPNFFTWPNDTVFMHPNSGGLVVLSWLAAAADTVEIAFSIADIDPNGGDGIAWFVDLNDAAGELASGVLANGLPPDRWSCQTWRSVPAIALMCSYRRTDRSVSIRPPSPRRSPAFRSRPQSC